MGCGQFKLSAELLRAALYLPDGTTIRNVVIDSHDPRVFVVFVEHADIPPTAEMALPVILHPTLTRDENGKTNFAGWGI